MTKKKTIKTLIWAYNPYEEKSDANRATAGALEQFREKLKLEIKPVYVMSPASFDLQLSLSKAHIGQYLPSTEKAMQLSLGKIHLKHTSTPEVLVQKSVSLRDAVKTLLKYATSKRADMIVTSTHASHGLDRLLVGSFSETLVLHSKIPVLVVNPGAQARPIQRILFPTDLYPQSKVFFDRVCELGKQLGAEVVLHHTIPHPIAPLFQSAVYLIGGGWVPIPEYMRAAEQSAREVAESWKQDAARAGVRVTTFFDAGRSGIRESILERAKKMEVGMIAMGAQSGTVGAALLGSVCRQVIREASCPVWIVRK